MKRVSAHLRQRGSTTRKTVLHSADMADLIPNILAQRYATPDLTRLWSAEGRIVLERELWIAVLRAQKDLGLDVPADAVTAYEKVKDSVNLPAIEERERVTRHDVKARIEEFCDLAGCEHIHKGMTSRDLTENVEQLQMHRSLQHVRDRMVAVVVGLAKRAEQWRDLPITARTHNVPAQVTTFGRRLAMFGEETVLGLNTLENVIERFAGRGIKGAVGTQLDQLTLFSGNSEKVAELERRVIHHLGIGRTLGATGQVYPRSLDFEVVSALCQAGSGPSSFARTLRLMAGNETASEGFAPGQVGSSAMPHKMNSRSCERINGFHTLLKGFVSMAAGLAGDQWNEGDVSCSVVRRVMLPDSFFAIDGLLETTLVVLQQIEAYPAVTARENALYLPFLLSTTFLMEAVRGGVGREEAHELIKTHAVAAVKALREEDAAVNTFADRIVADETLGLDADAVTRIQKEGARNFGNAQAQVSEFLKSADAVAADYPEAATYRPGSIL